MTVALSNRLFACANIDRAHAKIECEIGRDRGLQRLGQSQKGALHLPVLITAQRTGVIRHGV
jgi:hypothetical protein